MIDNEGGTREEQGVPASYLAPIIQPPVILAIFIRNLSGIKIIFTVPQLMILDRSYQKETIIITAILQSNGDRRILIRYFRRSVVPLGRKLLNMRNMRPSHDFIPRTFRYNRTPYRQYRLPFRPMDPC